LLFYLSEQVNTNFELKFAKLMTAKKLIYSICAVDMTSQYIL